MSVDLFTTFSRPKSDDFLLSRLFITGKLDIDTPLEVILSIADVHSIDYSYLEQENNSEKDVPEMLEKIKRLIDEINEEKVETLNKRRRDEDYEKMAHFVNPNKDISWTKEDLEISFNFLLTFTDNRFYKDITPTFSFGQQTSGNLRSLNESVVYAVCKYYGIELDLYTKVDEMVSMLRFFLTNSELIISSISNKLLSYDIDAKKLLDIEYLIVKSLTKSIKVKENNYQEINLQDTSPLIEKKSNDAIKNENSNQSGVSLQQVKFSSVDYQKLKKISDDVNTHYPTENSIFTYKVKSHEDAIVMASILYGFDITNENDPLLTYQLIKSDKYEGSIKFNSNFYIEMYSTRILKLILKEEGYTDEELDTLDKEAIYESLQIISLSNNFYHGKKTPSLHKETFIDNENIKELDNNICISFGNFEGYVIYTYKELYKLYDSSKILYEPNELKYKIPLSYYAIKKLKSLIRKNCPESTRNDFSKLILNLTDAFSTSDSILNKIKEDIESDSTRKEVLFNFMDILIKLSMNMRGWSGKGEYPIKNAHELEAETIDMRVGEALAQLEIYLDAYPDICKTILTLPLLKYYNNKYIQGDDTNGRTLNDRLKIIKGPRNNAHSCIKLSSNWFASSSYRYCKFFGIDPKFNIEDLKQIS